MIRRTKHSPIKQINSLIFHLRIYLKLICHISQFHQHLCNVQLRRASTIEPPMKDQPIVAIWCSVIFFDVSFASATVRLSFCGLNSAQARCSLLAGCVR